MIMSFVGLCYNQEVEIQKLIDSIKDSNIPEDEYEIIIIDDFSTDRSVEVLKEADIKNIKIIQMDKNTRNQSSCRNIGINNSIGDYVLFFDGDDYFNSENLYYVYSEILKDLSIDVYSPQKCRINIDNTVEYTNIDFKYIIENGDLKNFTTSICHYIINRNFIIENNVFFEEDKYNWHCEDLYYTILLLDKCKTMIKFETEKYTYVAVRYPESNICEYIDMDIMWKLEYMNDMKNDLLKIIRNKNIIDMLDDIFIGAIFI